MNRLAILAFALVTVADCAPSALGSNGRIVGGSTAADGQFPYQVSLRQNGNHFCGGSILNDMWIVTAAHCVLSMTGQEVVVTGTNSLSSGGQGYGISTILYHADFNPQALVNDVAVIKVQQPIQFNSKVQAISLNRQNIGGGVPLTLSGWGLTSYPGNIPDRLQYAVLNSLSTSQCSSGLQQQILDSQLCTFTHVGQGACQGDSGGPLVLGGSLAGIVSWGNPCAKGVPDVFTRVSAFADWIDYVTANN